MVFHFSFFIAMDGGTLSPFDIIQRKFACVHTHTQRHTRRENKELVMCKGREWNAQKFAETNAAY